MSKNTMSPEAIRQLLVPAREDCCGCGACMFICPVGAITMVPDEEGFDYPAVDTAKCVACKNCITICAFKADMK